MTTKMMTQEFVDKLMAAIFLAERTARFEVSGFSIGSIRHDFNADFYSVDPCSPLAMVADGVGNDPTAPYAAAHAGLMVTEQTAEFEKIKDVSVAEVALTELISKIHTELTALTGRFSARMRTTICVVLILEVGGLDWAVVAWVGDSRAYLWDGKELTCKTLDDGRPRKKLGDTPEAMEIQDRLDTWTDYDKLTPADQKMVRKRNVLSQAVGDTLKAPVVHTTSFTIPSRKSIVLLTTDGVHDTLTREQMALTVSKNARVLDNVCEGIIQGAYALAHKETDTSRAHMDDTTCIAIRRVPPPPKSKGGSKRTKKRS